MRTKIVQVTPFRRSARATQRDLQAALDCAYARGFEDGSEFHRLKAAGVPDWAHGVRVEKAGWFQWAVVATENRGH